MYTWCCARLPRWLVDVLWVLWYVFLLMEVILCLDSDRAQVAIFYLHG